MEAGWLIGLFIFRKTQKLWKSRRFILTAALVAVLYARSIQLLRPRKKNGITVLFRRFRAAPRLVQMP